MIAINSNPKQIFSYLFTCISLGTYKPGLWIVEFDVNLLNLAKKKLNKML